MPKTFQPKPCRICGGVKGTYPSGRSRGWYCEPCSRQMWVKYDMQVRLCSSTSEDHHRWNCLECQRIKRESQKASAKRGAQTRAVTHPHLQKPMNAQLFWQSKAHAMVSAAKKHGLLPQLDGSIACADCGNPASQYDHRDYGRPLDVQPVCGSCNRRRGTAKWPCAGDYAFKRIGEAPAKPAQSEAA